MNEKLVYHKFYGKDHKDVFFWPQKLQKGFNSADLMNVLETIKLNFNDLIENFCGVLEDNCLFQELSAEDNKEEVIIQIRELNMFKVLQEEVIIL